MIIETSANHFFKVTETGDPNLAHVWSGVQVKRNKATGVWEPVRNGRYGSPSPVLVRKAATRVVEG